MSISAPPIAFSSAPSNVSEITTLEPMPAITSCSSGTAVGPVAAMNSGRTYSSEFSTGISSRLPGRTTEPFWFSSVSRSEISSSVWMFELNSAGPSIGWSDRISNTSMSP